MPVEPVDMRETRTPGIVRLYCQCVSCGKVKSFLAPREGFHKYFQYMFGGERVAVQTCFPDVKPEHREMMQSGVGPCCFPKPPKFR